jgi:hypothetical protein
MEKTYKYDFSPKKKLNKKNKLILKNKNKKIFNKYKILKKINYKRIKIKTKINHKRKKEIQEKINKFNELHEDKNIN